MNICMMSNTFTPHVGGVARSVESFTRAYRELGHQVLVVAPVFADMPKHEDNVIRVPAIQHYSGSDFSIRLSIPGFLKNALDNFRPHLIHSHHPFLLGGTALCEAAARRIPLIFTHHTMYEQYTHYVPGDSPPIRAFAIELATGYANLCDRVIAPSESVAGILQSRGVTTPIAAIPTGVDVGRFKAGDGASFRAKMGISRDAFIVGHVGRLAPEKNLNFLAAAVSAFMERTPRAHFLIIGSGPSETELRTCFQNAGLASRTHFAGSRDGTELIDAYHAMDIFAFASKSETQGMVLAEAMATGVPVIGLDAPGVREVIRDGENGRLIQGDDRNSFTQALEWFENLDPAMRENLSNSAWETAQAFSLKTTAARALSLYESILSASGPPPGANEDSSWSKSIRMLGAEWEVWANVAHAANIALATPFHESPSSRIEIFRSGTK
ncbi:MAG: glycosyltransferase [Candidatus Hydrogenedentota bacterium]